MDRTGVLHRDMLSSRKTVLKGALEDVHIDDTWILLHTDSEGLVVLKIAAFVGLFVWAKSRL